MKTPMQERDQSQHLITQAQAGDRRSFDELMAQYRGQLESVVRSSLDPEIRAILDVDGIVQEVFLRAFESIEDFQWRGDGSFSAWLRGIARNVVLNLIRKKRPSHGLQIVEEMPAANVSPSRVARREERFDRLHDALSGLSPAHREVLTLSRIDGLSIQQVASRMGRSPDAIKKLLSRALKALKESFGDTESLHLPDRRLESEGERDGE